MKARARDAGGWPSWVESARVIVASTAKPPSPWAGSKRVFVFAEECSSAPTDERSTLRFLGRDERRPE